MVELKAHLRTRSFCGKYNFLNAAKMPYAMLQKCPTCCENVLRRCKNALNMLQKCRNFTMHILIITVIIITVINIIIIVIIIIINNFVFVGIIQHFKILQIVFRAKKLIKSNCKPSKMKVLKDTFQQSFKLHIYWWELREKRTNHKYLHVHINTHTHKRIRTWKNTHAHIDYRHNYMIIYTPIYPYTHRLTKIYFN